MSRFNKDSPFILNNKTSRAALLESARKIKQEELTKTCCGRFFSSDSNKLKKSRGSTNDPQPKDASGLLYFLHYALIIKWRILLHCK